MVRTSSVLAVPGSPVIRQWPPTNRPIITCSSTSSCPTITRRTCFTISALHLTEALNARFENLGLQLRRHGS